MSKIQNVKTHVKKNKAAYITGGVCLLVGAVGGGLYMATRPEMQVVQKATLIGWKNKNVQIQFIERSTPSKPVHLKGTQQYFDSIRAAARETGLDRTLISKHLGGHLPDVKGNVFEFVEVTS